MRQKYNIEFHINAIKTKIQRMEKINSMPSIPYDIVDVNASNDHIVLSIIVDTSEIEVSINFATFTDIPSFQGSVNHYVKHHVARIIVELQKKLIAHQFELQLLNQMWSRSNG